MIDIEQPAMALNAVDCPPPMKMWNSWDVQGHFKRRDIINWTAEVAKTAPGGKLKSVVICCHADPAHLYLGEGFKKPHTYLFKAWKGLVDVIYLQGCSIAAGDGYSFCSEIAVYAGCYVVAATVLQKIRATTLPPGKIDVFEGMTITFGPNGKPVTKLSFPTAWTKD